MSGSITFIRNEYDERQWARGEKDDGTVSEWLFNDHEELRSCLNQLKGFFGDQYYTIESPPEWMTVEESSVASTFISSILCERAGWTPLDGRSVILPKLAETFAQFAPAFLYRHRDLVVPPDWAKEVEQQVADLNPSVWFNADEYFSEGVAVNLNGDDELIAWHDYPTQPSNVQETSW